MVHSDNNKHAGPVIDGGQNSSNADRADPKTGSGSTGPIIGAAGALGLALYKFKFAILGVIKGFSLVKLGWILKGSASMLLSVGMYAMMFGWRYALILVALIYIHELGHYAWMKIKGLDPDAPVFVPFIGAYTAMKKLPPDPVVHAEVAYAGPLVGGVAALGLWLLAQSNGSVYLLAAANTGLVLNLFQLIPMRPFDGGFIAACISKKLAVAGVVMMVLLGFALQSILLLILAGVGYFMLVKKRSQAPCTVPDYATRRLNTPAGGTGAPSAVLALVPDTITPFVRFRISIAYFGLAAVLGIFYAISQMQLGYITQHR